MSFEGTTLLSCESKRRSHSIYTLILLAIWPYMLTLQPVYIVIANIAYN